MPGFSLKTINAPVPSLYVGQGGLHGSSGRDSAYLQIAKAPGHGTVYATPHYLDGYTVYCLEHTLPGPGENISGGGQQPTGPYVIVDMDSYRTNPGYSSIIYHESTLHAIGWVLRHTYPFMVIDDDDPDNETWSRVAGQFAIRQVIRELEGPQYVRDYWNMDNFYRASGQAPGVYLEYARWLAANGIARASMTGAISVSNQSTHFSGGSLTGTVTLTTDADLIRVSRSYGVLTGNTAGQDESYYYLNSGDTVSITAPGTHLSFVAESVSSDEEEASFLVGVPDVAIQKVLIPQYGAPYKLQSVTVTFDMPLGAAAVTKTSASTGAPLAGAVFELVSGDAVIATQTTGADGVARFENLQPGVYTIREKSAPEGYLVSVPGEQSVTVTAGGTAHASFANAEITGKIRVVKRDSLTREALAGAEFTVTRLSAPAGATGVGGSVVIVTDASGVAETGWLPWGRYRIEETTVPQHYVDVGFETEVEIRDSGRTCEIEVENEPTKGYIRITKTDRLNGNPIEGVRFDIYENDEYGSALVGSMVTDENGVAVSELLRKGRYIVREHGETAGYVFEEIALDAVVKPDETTDLSVTNQPVRVRLKLYKRDADEYAGKPADAPGTRGLPVYTQAQLDAMCAYANAHGMQIAIHAIGDGMLDRVLDACEKALVAHPRRDHRHGVVHCQITRPDQLERIRKLGMHVYLQSIFLDYDTRIVFDRVGPALAGTSYAAKSLLQSGVTFSNGSDAPVEDPAVLRGVECAVTRRSIGSTAPPYRPEESLSVREALDSFTQYGAYASFEENCKGRIRAGMLADFVVLGENPFETAPDRLHAIDVLATYLGGACVYRREDVRF